MDDHERITHEDLHHKISSIESALDGRLSSIVRWIAASIVTMLGLGMGQLVSVASTLAEHGSVQQLVRQDIGRLDRAVENHRVELRQTTEKLHVRIQQESAEAESDLKDHRKEAHQE